MEMTHSGPILFQGAMVCPVLAGTKTKTRRAVRLAADQQARLRDRSLYLQRMYGTSPPPNPVEFGQRGLWRIVGPDYPDGDVDNVRCPYGAPGDLLWVREPWRATSSFDLRPPRDIPQDANIWYEADGEGEPHWWGRYRHARFMCRWMSRITLEITNVRVERLLDISAADALAEGIIELPDGYGLPGGAHFHAADPRQSYFSLWEAINGPGSVQANPLVWALSFTRIKEPESGL